MSKIALNITMNIDDTSEVDLAQKIDILRKNERLSEFCSQAIKQALDDPETCEDMNKNIINISKIGYIINDMNDGNVMITDSGKLKIIDVGLFYKVIRTQERIYKLNMIRAEEVIGEIESLVK